MCRGSGYHCRSISKLEFDIFCKTLWRSFSTFPWLDHFSICKNKQMLINFRVHLKWNQLINWCKAICSQFIFLLLQMRLLINVCNFKPQDVAHSGKWWCQILYFCSTWKTGNQTQNQISFLIPRRGKTK